ncbi:MAG: hypothetical protein AAF525_08860 [Pseudomonadota bacterium]
MSNESFADLWADIWTVSSQGCGIGHITSRLLDNGNVEVTRRMDLSLEEATDRPEDVADKIWTKSVIELVDAERFIWCRYQSNEGGPSPDKSPFGMFYDGETVVEPLANGLSVTNGGESTLLDFPGEGPVVPDIQLPLYASAKPHDKSLEYPFQSLGFWRNEKGRSWHLLPLTLRYAGKKGPQTGLGHAYEAALPEDIGRTFSVWVDDRHRFVGTADEQEGQIAVDDEETARAVLSARSPGTILS